MNGTMAEAADTVLSPQAWNTDPSAMDAYHITDTEFHAFSKLLYDIAGITLTDSKKILLTGRLARRLSALGMGTYTQYYKYVTGPEHADELQTMVDLLTTNETYFFREPQHFEFLQEVVLPQLHPGQMFRVWSAAASNGSEAYTIAMVLADRLKENYSWEVFGTDISLSILDQARRGQYRLEDAGKIPPQYLKRFCLKGIHEEEGTFIIDPLVKRHVHFDTLNLIDEHMRKPGEFDVIFLRNVLIYFDLPTKKHVIDNLVPCMKKGGYLNIGHAETLNGVNNTLTQLKPTIYRNV
jgi:chemotaxis protein methyltransferase CheR